MSPALVKMDNPIEGRARSCRWETSNTLVARAERAFAGIAGPPVLCPHNILFGGRKMWAADEMGARGRRDVGQGGREGGLFTSGAPSPSGPLGSLGDTGCAPGCGALDDAKLTNKPQNKQKPAISKNKKTIWKTQKHRSLVSEVYGTERGVVFLHHVVSKCTKDAKDVRW